jgi:hypothetical protein
LRGFPRFADGGVAPPPLFLCGALPEATAMRRATWAATLMLAGCVGGSDPAASRLEPGQVVMVYAPEPATEVTATDPAADGRYPLAVGSKVRVVDDAAEGGPGRPVRVAAGLVGDLCRVPRENLRPAR